MIDLTPFCSKDKYRGAILKPFSRGEWTYATNGHILIRVPRGAEVPEVDNSPVVERIWPKGSVSFRSPSTLALPPGAQVFCETCEGRGTKHDCPDCTCECEKCGGVGRLASDETISIMVGKIAVAMKYARMLIALPDLEVADDSASADQVPVLLFRFNGGDGMLACLKRADASGWTVSDVVL